MSVVKLVEFEGRPAQCGKMEMKTDLNLLLECLKFQMDCPESQRDSLAAVRSICQNNSNASEYFREIGGLMFIASLAKSSPHLILKEASLYTLGVLAESSVFCQQTLCSLELFEDIHAALSNEQSSVNLKRISAFLLLVLVSNNKAGQVLARESGCIDLLLSLFSSTLMRSMLLSVESTDLQYQLWLSVCSTLCACVNNPQNEENQKLCSSAFPLADKWLQHSMDPDIVRPICSLIGLSVANNRSAQDHFNSIGGLDTLANILVKLMNGLQTKQFTKKLAVAVTKTLDACIAENAKAVHHLSKHRVISSLTTLLSEHLDLEDKFSIVLALGHCTEDCEPNQYELLKSNGLPLIIQVLTESQDEELHKAATFVLQNCRQMTEMLSLSLNEQSPNAKEPSTSAWIVPDKQKHMDHFWEKAKAIYHKIQYLQQHREDRANAENPDSRRSGSASYQKVSGSRVQAATAMPRLPYSASSPQQPACTEPLEQSHCANNPSSDQVLDRGVCAHTESIQMEKVSRQIYSDAAAVHTATATASHPARETVSDKSTTLQETPAEQMCRDQSCRSDSSRNYHYSRDAVTETGIHHVTDDLHDNLLRPERDLLQEEKQIPPPMHPVCNSRRNSARNSPSVKKATPMDPMTLCADIISKEISSIAACRASQSQMRCSGCLMTGSSINSRNCSKILLECPHLCDRHKIILQAEERYKTELKKLLHGSRISTLHNNIQLTPLRKGGTNIPKESVSSRFLLTPIKSVNQKKQHYDTSKCYLQNLEEMKRSPEKKQEIINNKLQYARHQNPERLDPIASQTVRRKDFTEKEIADLLDGVRKFGRHWNAILWSYPFQKGRKNVDLAKKYRQLQQRQLKGGE